MAGKGKEEHYPVVRQGRFDYTGPAVTPQIELNIEQYLSKTNRRLYRHSRVYHTKLDIDPNSTQTYNVYVLNDSWMTCKAMQMAYEKYEENAESEKEDLAEQQVARWEDFRTQSGTGYQVVNPAQYELPTLTPVQLTAGEFNLTQVVDAAGTTRTFTWGVPASTRYGILDEYDKAGNAQAAPTNTTGDMPYDDLMADDSGAMAGYIQTRGNLPPYDADGVNQDATWVKVATLGAGTAQRLSTGFFKAPCGFVIITAGANQDELVDIGKFEWTVRSGDYKGVHAPSMLE